MEKVIINLNENKMAHIDKWGKCLVWDLNKENFPEWIDLTKMNIESSQNDIIVYVV